MLIGNPIVIFIKDGLDALHGGVGIFRFLHFRFLFLTIFAAIGEPAMKHFESFLGAGIIFRVAELKVDLVD